MTGLRVRPATDDDLERVCEIVNHYIEKTVFNFRTEPQTLDEWRSLWKRTARPISLAGGHRRPSNRSGVRGTLE